MSELQTKSEKIKLLNEQIEKLAESDKELKKSKELLNESKKKLQESQKLQREADVSRDKATTEMKEAISMKNMLKKKISDSVDKEKKLLEREKTRIINSHNIDHYTKVGHLPWDFLFIVWL